MSLTKNDRNFQSPSGKTFPTGSFAGAIAQALHREFAHEKASVKTVVGLTGANERAVRNWFDAKNGPSGEYLVTLCQHSNEVLMTVLLLAGRTEFAKATELSLARNRALELAAALRAFCED